MKARNLINSSGKIPKWLLILGGIFVLIVIIAITGGGKEKKETVFPTPEKPITEIKVGEIVFKLIEAKDLGSVLKGSEGRFSEWETPKDKTTEGKFIKVTVEAKNVGKKAESLWGIFRVKDAQEREFREASGVYEWLPEDNQCSETLKPGFSPKRCTEIFEVASDSTGLKAEVGSGIFGRDYLNLGI